MKTGTCPKCGSGQRDRGEVSVVGSNWEVRFKAEDAPLLSGKKKVVAWACLACGYIELYLADHEDSDAG